MLPCWRLSQHKLIWTLVGVATFVAISVFHRAAETVTSLPTGRWGPLEPDLHGMPIASEGRPFPEIREGSFKGSFHGTHVEKSFDGESRNSHPTVATIVPTTHSAISSSPIPANQVASLPFPPLGVDIDSLDRQNHPRLWLHVLSFGEGLASWRRALAEVIVAAKLLNASVVEPCIAQGKLLSCSKLRGRRPIQLRDIFNLTHIQDLHPFLFVSHRAFQQYFTDTASTSSINTTRFCMHTGKPVTACIDREGRATLPTFHGAKTIPPMDEVIRGSAATVVVEMFEFRKLAFRRATVNGIKAMDKELFEETLQHLVFRQEHFDAVDTLLDRMDIRDGTHFNVVHWRAEALKEDYLTCAKRVVSVRDALTTETETNISTILISSINQRKNLQWNRLSRAEGIASTEALDFLEKEGLRKIDTYWQPSEVPDIAFLAIWDLILAMKAYSYATCSIKCKHKHACSGCNYRGFFAETSLELRSGLRKQSHDCWPP